MARLWLSLFLVVVAVSLASGKPWWGKNDKKKEQEVGAHENGHKARISSDSSSSSDEDKGKKGKHGSSKYGKSGGAHVQGGAPHHGDTHHKYGSGGGGSVKGSSGVGVEGGYKANGHGHESGNGKFGGSVKVGSDGSGYGKFGGSVKGGSDGSGYGKYGGSVKGGFGGGSYGAGVSYKGGNEKDNSQSVYKSDKNDENNQEHGKGLLGWFNFR